MESTTPFQPWAADDNSKNVKTERELVDDAKLHRENVNHPKHRQTASYDKDSVVVSAAIPGPSSATPSGISPGGGKVSKMDSGKIASMQQIVENTLSQEGRQRVSQLLEAVEALSGAERLLLYLRLPTGVPPHDPLKQPINPLGSRAELQQTVTWIQTHLEVDPDVSLPKQDVYDEYIAHCMSSNMKPLSTADFGKVMKQVYPSVRPRRLGTRGNSRYCYAGLRKKVKLEVPQLPDLGETSKEPSVMPKERERIVCDWAETKFGIKFANITELSRHVMASATRTPLGPASASPPLMPTHASSEDVPGPQMMKQQLKRKIVGTPGTPGRPKKNKGLEVAGESPPSTSYVSQHPVKHESELLPEPAYTYQSSYVYDVRPTFPYTPPRAHPPHAPHAPPAPHPALPVDYRPDPYVFEPPYAHRDLAARDSSHNLPINLSSDASLDLSTERTEWQRRRPPDPPAAPVAAAPPAAASAPAAPAATTATTARLPLPGKKLILETYQSETRAGSPRPPPDARPAEYLPKKMRAAEILGGKLAAARFSLAEPSSSAPAHAPAHAAAEPSVRPEVAFLEDPKNLTSRSKSTAAALAREEQEAASPTRAAKVPPPRGERARPRRPRASPDSCCGIDGINIKSGMICQEGHSEILNRERVISICNIDKHDLDDYLNEGNSQEHEEELLQYFPALQREAERDAPHADEQSAFLETGPDPHDEHSQGNSEKISQLRALLAKNLKNQSGSTVQNTLNNQESGVSIENDQESHVTKNIISEGAFKPVGNVLDIVNGTSISNENELIINKNCDTIANENATSGTRSAENNHSQLVTSVGSHLYNGNCHNEPQSPTTRTQQYDFVPISDGCQSPGNFNSKSPLGFGHRGHSPTKTSKSIIMGGSLQTSPISHSTAASPFVSPRNTPVPRSRYCSRPIPKHNGRKRRNPLTLGVNDSCPKQFAIPNDQKFMSSKAPTSGPNIKYCQPMSAPPSPNILSHYKQTLIQNSGMQNGNNVCLNFVQNTCRDNINGEIAQPLSADPLSSEISRFFQEPMVHYRIGHDASFRSQSVPLKQAPMSLGLLSYNTTPVGSVPPTPVPNEFCDFGPLADTCDISKAGLNSETLDKIYDAIDSSNDVLNSGASTGILNTGDALTNNGCDSLADPLTDEQLSSLIPSGGELLDRSAQFSESFPNDACSNVEDFLKRTNRIDYIEIPDLEIEKNKYYTSRSVPSTPLPFKRAAPNLQINSRRSRELFATDTYSNISNGISSKSVPSTPQLVEDRSVFSYSNRDFLINGNSVELCTSNQIRSVVENDQLTSPLDILREDILDPLTPAADLLADLDKIDGTPYVDL